MKFRNPAVIQSAIFTVSLLNQMPNLEAFCLSGTRHCSMYTYSVQNGQLLGGWATWSCCKSLWKSVYCGSTFYDTENCGASWYFGECCK